MALDITCVYVGALPSDGKGVYTQVKWQPSFDHWQCQQKADWESFVPLWWHFSVDLKF